MAKKLTRRKTKRPARPQRVERALVARRELESALRQERKIKRLAGELRRAIFNADDALRTVARIAVERDMPTASSLRDTTADLEDAGAVAGIDPRD